MYSEQPFINPLTGVIAQTIGSQNEGKIRALEIAADAQARAQQQSGQAWAQAIGNIGQIPQQMVQMKAAQQESDLRKAQLAEVQQRQSDLKALDQAYQQPGGRDAILNAVPGHLRPQVQQSFQQADELGAKVTESQVQAANAVKEYVGGLAKEIGTHGFDPTAAQLAISHAKTLFKDSPPMLAQLTQVEGAIRQNPTPEAVKSIIQPLIPPQLMKTTEGETVTDVSDLKHPVVVAQGQPKPPTEAELAVKAAQGDPTATQAMGILKPKNADTPGAAEAKYLQIQAKANQNQPLTPDEQAFAKAYEKNKTLTVDTSASAAADRQAATIAQQTDQQRRAQDFTEGQAGRKEYTEKASVPYQTSLASVQTIRDTVAAAKAGNNVAGALQNLETTMGAIRSQGLNRINTAELGLPAQAGSFMQRVSGEIGGLIDGKSKSIPPQLQQDMLDFANILEKNAVTKYQRQRASIVQTYRGLTVPDESQPSTTGAPTAPTGDTVTVGGFTVKVKK